MLSRQLQKMQKATGDKIFVCLRLTWYGSISSTPCLLRGKESAPDISKGSAAQESECFNLKVTFTDPVFVDLLKNAIVAVHAKSPRSSISCQSFSIFHCSL